MTGRRARARSASARAPMMRRRPAVGTAAAGSTVSVFDGGALLGTAVADGGGSGTLPPAPSTTAPTVSRPRRPTRPATPARPQRPSRDHRRHRARGSGDRGVRSMTPRRARRTHRGESTDDATPTLFGTAAAGSTVTVFDGGALLGTAVADAGGMWSVTPRSLTTGLIVSRRRRRTRPATPARPRLLRADHRHERAPAPASAGVDDAPPARARHDRTRSPMTRRRRCPARRRPAARSPCSPAGLSSGRRWPTRGAWTFSASPLGTEPIFHGDGDGRGRQHQRGLG